MADLLIYDMENYMDAWTPVELAQRIKDDPEVEAKYKRRYQKGDIIERQPDGYWSGEKGKNFDKSAFCVVNVPDNDMRDYDKPLYDIQITPEDQLKTLKKRKYNIDTLGLVFTDKKAVSLFANLNLTIKEELSKHG